MRPMAGGGRTGAIVVGAGHGRRLGGIEKAFLSLGGRPLLVHAVAALEQAPGVDVISLVLAETSIARGRVISQECGWRKVSAIVAGGRERADSVRAGLRALTDCEWVLIHDAARPFLTGDLICAGLVAAQVTGAATAALPVRDTLKLILEDDADGAGGTVRQTVDRRALWAAQTPQVFRTSVLWAAYTAAGALASTYTDDASLVEAMGCSVRVFAGAVENMKITLPQDVAVAEALLRQRTQAASDEVRASGGSSQVTSPAATGAGAGRAQSPVRAGTGYDLHRLESGRRLVLGGVIIPWQRGLAGHSDGDVLAHAVIDALFGACGVPDIGQHFPPGDARYADADSIALLAQARQLVETAGFQPCNVDATVVCEQPRLASFVLAMRCRLAEALGLPVASVNVKAKTNEGLDATGRGEAIAAHAIILVAADSERR